jgi:hypothetical protein
MPSELELESLFKFNIHDLEANRLGQFSAGQKERLARSFGMQRIGGSLFGIVFASLGIWLISAENQWFIGIIFLILGGLVTVSMFLLGSVSVDELHVQRVSGWIEKKIDDGSDSTSYYLIIGTNKFSVEKRQFDAFQVGDLYSFYYYQRQIKNLSEAPQILAAEISTEYPEETKKHEAS